MPLKIRDTDGTLKEITYVRVREADTLSWERLPGPPSGDPIITDLGPFAIPDGASCGTEGIYGSTGDGVQFDYTYYECKSQANYKYIDTVKTKDSVGDKEVHKRTKVTWKTIYDSNEETISTSTGTAGITTLTKPDGVVNLGDSNFYWVSWHTDIPPTHLNRIDEPPTVFPNTDMTYVRRKNDWYSYVKPDIKKHIYTDPVTGNPQVYVYNMDNKAGYLEYKTGSAGTVIRKYIAQFDVTPVPVTRGTTLYVRMGASTYGASEWVTYYIPS